MTRSERIDATSRRCNTRIIAQVLTAAWIILLSQPSSLSPSHSSSSSSSSLSSQHGLLGGLQFVEGFRSGPPCRPYAWPAGPDDDDDDDQQANQMATKLNRHGQRHGRKMSRKSYYSRLHGKPPKDWAAVFKRITRLKRPAPCDDNDGSNNYETGHVRRVWDNEGFGSYVSPSSLSSKAPLHHFGVGTGRRVARTSSSSSSSRSNSLLLSEHEYEKHQLLPQQHGLAYQALIDVVTLSKVLIEHESMAVVRR